MPSPHLERKLKEALGDDAGRELGTVTDRIDPLRGDIGELRHEVKRDIAELRHEVKRDLGELRHEVAEFRGEVQRELTAMGHQFDLLRAEMATMREGIRADVSEAFVKQTRWMLGGLALILTAILFKG